MIISLKTRAQSTVRWGMPLAATAILLFALAPSGWAAGAALGPAAQDPGKSSETSAASPAPVLKTISAAQTFESVSICPDGSRVAWVERLKGKDGAPSGNSAIYIAPVNSGVSARRITAKAGNPHAETSPVWSPDGRQVAFFSDAAKAGQQQLYVARVADGMVKRMTNVVGFVAAPAWSPRGAPLIGP